MTTLNKVSAKDYLYNIRDTVVKIWENNPNDWAKMFMSKNMPVNAVTGKHYNSTNFFNLNFVANQNNYGQNIWASFLDWKKIGCKIKILKSNDPRSYRQDSSKLIGCGFKRKFNVDNAIDEIIFNYKKNPKIEKPSCYTVKWMIKNNIS